MRVEFLRGLGLEDEVINKIQAESGKDITATKEKYQAQVDSLTGQVAELQTKVTQRETDLTDLQTKLTEAGQSATKLGELQSNFQSLQDKYNQETAEYKAKLEKQNYEFSVREATNDIKFSSNAAKKAFIDTLMDKKLNLEGGKLIGFSEFLAEQKKEDPRAFEEEQPPQDNKPKFAPPSNPTQPHNDAESKFGFNFIGVRSHEN